MAAPGAAVGVDGLDPTEARMMAALARAERGELLTVEDMAAIFRMSRATFDRHAKRGAFDKFRVVPRVGRPLYSGAAVHRAATAQPVYQPTFAAKRSAR